MTDIASLQTVLAAEHAAVYVFGVLGGRTSQTAEPGLFAAVSATYETHLARRDRLVAAVDGAGDQPVAAQPAYDVPARLDTAAQLTRLALATERSCATTYSWLVASTDGDWRSWAVAALTETAVNELAFGGEPEAFPGADDLG